MSNKNEVFEYLIDQLRQQLPAVDVMGEIKRWCIDRSIAGRGSYTEEENAVIDAYIGLEHNPYKQQCEDLAHEVRSLKNQLRDASVQIKELHLALATATGDGEAYKLIRKGGYVNGGQRYERYVVGEHVPEQSGCRKDGVRERKHDWLHSKHKTGFVCFNCGARKEDTQESCWIEWSGGACPVPSGTLVDVIYRDGEILYGLPADELNDTERDASVCFWRHDGMSNDIVRYRKAVL